MQRHPGLRGLSREHHRALVMVRTLRKEAARVAASRAEIEIVISRAQEEWRLQVAPHFAVEERELLPLSYGSNAALNAHAETIRADHAALRTMITNLRAEEFAQQAGTLADRLEAHVRFEEQHWFPSLQTVLDADTLGALQWRLQLEPCVPIVGFRPDEQEGQGVWLANLACGHSQHVRHKPPFQNAIWVTTEEGRHAKCGTCLNCILCRMPRLPPRAVVYKQTAIFDEQSVPQGLLNTHDLRAGTWGQIVLMQGRLDYVIEEPLPLTVVLRPGVDGVVAPECRHHVRLHAGAQFQVRFLRVG